MTKPHPMPAIQLCYGLGWSQFGSLLSGLSFLVIHQFLIISGDVEVNPGPLDHEIEKILSEVDNTCFEEEDWNTLISECSSLRSHWDTIGGFLGLPASLLADIRENNPTNNTKCWNEILLQWINQNYNTKKFGQPSWRTLLKAVAKVNKKTFTTLVKDHQVKAKSNATTTSATACSLSEFKGSSMSFPTISLDPKEKRQRYERLCSKSQEMTYKFQKLFSATKKSLLNERVPVIDLVGHLECLGSIKPMYKDAGQSPLRRHLPELANAKSVNDVMSVVKDYCSFFNYHMLQHIIEEFGTTKDKENLAAYKKDFEEYAQCCVIEGSMAVGKMSEDGFSNMFVTLDDSFDNCNLSHLNVFVADIRKALKISSDVDLRLCYINRGSIKLTFQLPHPLWEDIFPLSPKQKALLADLGVVELSCGDYQFTRQYNKEEVEDPCVSDGGNSDYADSNAELASMATELTLRKPGDTFSITDSALGRSSYTGTTAAVTVATEDVFNRKLDDFPMGMGKHVTNIWDYMDPYGIYKSCLHSAVLTGNLQKVRHLIEEENLNPLKEVGKKQVNAIHMAAIGGHVDVMRYFIEDRGHNAACLDGEGWTPLHHAANRKHLELVQYLVEKQQVESFIRNELGQTALHLACAGGSIDVIHYLAKEMSKYLPLKDVVHDRDHKGQFPLSYAAAFGNMEAIQFLTSANMNCDPNTTDYMGRIPLYFAAQQGHLNIVKYAVEQLHCDPSCTDKYNCTPLHFAALKGRLDIVKYLTLEQHCNHMCRDMVGDTPLHWAAREGQLEVVKFFIETLHCLPNIRGIYKMTPLDAARIQRHHHVLKYLTAANNAAVALALIQSEISQLLL